MNVELMGIFQQKETRLSFVDGALKEGPVKTNFIVVRLEDTYYYVRPIDDRLRPQGRGRLVLEDEFLTDFLPDPAFFFQCLHPVMVSLRKRIQSVGGNIKSLTPNTLEKRVLGLFQLADAVKDQTHNGFVLALRLAVSAPLTATAARHALVQHYFTLANRLHTAHHDEQAVLYLRHALGLDPADKRVLSLLRELYAESGIKREEETDLRQVV
ncbi:hypothetical protein [Desulfovibrio inopinatus]|uniref:hypothetical protein n=1 Tax=Desulfovibrio inopinatus TaxID=102109 RepID=UPI000411E377|nr:hypothetical protein [Desulfovibrio inopinatus]